MPIYEYECSRCGVFEVMQGINEEPLKTCPHCRRCKVKKLISESSFHLKGSGWYATDYGRSEAKGGNGKDHHKQETETASDSTAPASEAKESKTKSDDSKTDSKSSANTPAGST